MSERVLLRVLCSRIFCICLFVLHTILNARLLPPLLVFLLLFIIILLFVADSVADDSTFKLAAEFEFCVRLLLVIRIVVINILFVVMVTGCCVGIHLAI